MLGKQQRQCVATASGVSRALDSYGCGRAGRLPATRQGGKPRGLREKPTLAWLQAAARGHARRPTGRAYGGRRPCQPVAQLRGARNCGSLWPPQRAGGRPGRPWARAAPERVPMRQRPAGCRRWGVAGAGRRLLEFLPGPSSARFFLTFCCFCLLLGLLGGLLEGASWPLERWGKRGKRGKRSSVAAGPRCCGGPHCAPAC